MKCCAIDVTSRQTSPALLAALLTVSACVLTACKVPNLSGFVDSATAVQSSMVQAGVEYRPIVEEFAPNQLDQFNEDWATVEGATDALVEYAQSINEIAAAGRDGAKGAKELADSVDQLVGRVGQFGIAASEITSVITDLYGIGAQAIAVKKLADTTEDAQAYIDAICTILADRVIDELADDLDLVQVAAEVEIDDAFPEVSENYDSLLESRKTLVTGLAEEQPDAWPPATVSQLAQVDQALAGLQPRYDEYQDALRQSRRLREEQKRLFAQLAISLRAFAEEHRALKASIESNSQFSLTTVQHATSEIRVIMGRIREIRDDG